MASEKITANVIFVMGNSCVPSISSPLLTSLDFLPGGPGAGKGTQCQRLKQEFGFAHYSAGLWRNLSRALSECILMV